MEFTTKNSSIVLSGNAISTTCACCHPCRCEAGELPDSVTVTFVGNQGSQEQGPSLLSVAFQSCMGFGATATANAPGGDQTGPVSSVTVTNGGSGYAVLGRAPPTLSLRNSSNQPINISVSLAQQTGECGVPTWTVQSASVESLTEGYENGTRLYPTKGAEDVQEEAFSGIIYVSRKAPTLDVVPPSSGSGLTFSVTIQQVTTDPDSWGVASISASGTPTGYTPGASLSFTGNFNAAESAAASATINIDHVEPSVQCVPAAVLGAGAALQCALTQLGTSSAFPRPTWTVSSIAVTAGGSGYSVGDTFNIVATDGEASATQTASVATVSGSGAITSLSIDGTGRYFKQQVSGFTVSDSGRYHANDAVSVFVEAGGKYYKPDASLPAISPPVTATVSQPPGGQGFGATLQATVNTNTQSPNFGKIASVAVTNGGSNYLGWNWVYSLDCQWIYGEPAGTDYSIVAYRVWEDNSPQCYYLGSRCWGGNQGYGLGPLVGMEVSSPLKTVRRLGSNSAYVVAPSGTPGVDNGPITGVVVGGGSELTRGWAYAGRSSAAPDRLSPGDHAVSCSMRKVEDFLYFWEVESVSVPPGITDFAHGEALSLYVNESAQTGYDGAFLERSGPGFSGDLWYDIPAPVHRIATGTAIVEDGELVGVALTDRGVFYRESPSSQVAPIVGEVTATVIQALPSAGSGAEITATVNVNTSSVSFGNLTLSVAAGGDGYLGEALGRFDVRVTYPGRLTPPTVGVCCGPQNNVVTYEAEEPIADCALFGFDAYFGDSKLTVEPGGEVLPIFEGSRRCCGECHNLCEDLPDLSQVVVTLTREATSGNAVLAADHVTPTGGAGTFEYIRLTHLGGPLPLESGFSHAVRFTAGQDMVMVDCPGDQREVVFDFDDLEEEQFCGALEVRTHPNQDGDTSFRISVPPLDSTITSLPSLEYRTWNELNREWVPGWNPLPPEVWVTNPPQSQNLDALIASVLGSRAERVTASILINAYGPLPVVGGRSMPAYRVSVQKNWSIVGWISGYRNQTTITHTKPPPGQYVACQDYKTAWSHTVEKSGDMQAVGDLGLWRWVINPAVRPGGWRPMVSQIELYYMTTKYRRICKDWDIDVEFQ